MKLSRPEKHGIEVLRCGAQTPSDRLRGHGTERFQNPSPRRWRVGASPHSVATHCHALYCRVLVTALLLSAALAVPGYAQSPAAAVPITTIAGPPEVLVLVYQQPGGLDQVDITYARLVPHAQVSADIDALTQLSGWPISARRIKDAAAPLQNRTGAMTSVTFQVPGVVEDSAHTFPVEVLARAFRKYRRMNAVFFVGPQFQFQGARSYADNDIKVVLDQHDTAYVYQVEVLGQDFGRLPLTQASAGTAHRSPWGILLGIAGIALLAGLLVYFLASRLPPPGPKRNIQERTQDAEAETGLEAGSRK